MYILKTKLEDVENRIRFKSEILTSFGAADGIPWVVDSNPAGIRNYLDPFGGPKSSLTNNNIASYICIFKKYIL
jgi:hypothetical protein